MNWNNDQWCKGNIPWRIGKLGQSYEVQLGWFILQLLWPNYGKDWRIRVDIVSYNQHSHYGDHTIIIPVSLIHSLYRNTIGSGDYSLRTIKYHMRRLIH